jgi:hypothetical protein
VSVAKQYTIAAKARFIARLCIYSNNINNSDYRQM